MVDNLIMPERVSQGFKGGPTFSTDKSTQVNMQTRRLMNVSIARHVYTWSMQDAPADLVKALRAFFYDRRGDFKVFLMKDWTNFQLVDEQIALGDGSTVAFQITKTETAGVNPYVRVIRHIKAGTLVVKVDGVTKTLTTDYTVNSTGLITFVSAPALDAVITVTADFYVPVAFEGDVFEASVPYQSLDIMSVDGLQAKEDIP
ncbi:hypothetical protein EN781_00105 [Mesorhizobium sp. M4A.F.Ca.ET.090.04.2.1]|uniref:DUF2460 domain-containing protein n=1 Tax=Mesorhizobium sp. M4A.F.Ca.ET.090.04.2.1 TaxID=2496663 RepID=UPI000FCCCB48|nr:DUF2460 domain-containing protein [Mesorhizobium sp. M4A.F.Ca.ET.090.04.2.1]RVC47574.1 hypothetical protein EN781_00105 [Mesorhizobium sp. M4A.F.Ca.ET.090.04.2.1]